MTTRFAILPDRVVFEKDGVSIFDTDKYPALFYPTSEAIVLTGVEVEFPNFLKGNAYSFNVGTIGGQVNGGCRSFGGAGYQDWGPESVGDPTELEDEIIGTVPSGTDMLMVLVKPTRTNAPDQINGQTVPVDPKEGEFNNAPRGCLLLERLFPMARMIEIFVEQGDPEDPTPWNVILRRRQTVGNGAYSYWNSGNNPNTSGWTYGGSYGSPGLHIFNAIEAKGPAFDPSGVAYRRGGSNACSLTDTSDHSSEYSLDITLLPGRSDIEHTAGEFEGLPQLVYLGTGNNPSSGVQPDPSTLTDAPFGAPAASRCILLAIATNRGTGSDSQVTGVTIGGVTATKLVDHFWNGDVLVTQQSAHASIWLAAVPDDTEGDIVLDFDAGPEGYLVHTFAVYNLQSTTPIATAHALGSAGGAMSLATLDGGLAFALNAAAFRNTGTLTDTNHVLSGIGNIINFVSAGSNAVWSSRGYQRTDGSTLSIDSSAPTAIRDSAVAAVSLR